jgi:hypothetical protein
MPTFHVHYQTINTRLRGILADLLIYAYFFFGIMFIFAIGATVGLSLSFNVCLVKSWPWPYSDLQWPVL